MKQRFLWGAWLLFSTFHPLLAQIHFSDLSASSKVQGLLRNGCYVYGHGVAIADISGDGLPDIYVANAAEGTRAFRELLYISHSGKAYSEEASDRGVADNYGIGSHGIVFFDMDNDGDFDLYNGNTSQPKDGVLAINRLYLNSNGAFEDWTSKGALSTSPVGSRSVIALDVNRDGYMDLYSVGSILPDYEAENNQLYINQGNRTFKLENYGLAGVNSKGFGPNGVTAADVNDDGYPEIYVSRVDRVVFGTISGVRAANQFFFRQANGTFVDRVHELKTAGSGWSDGATFVDYDTDGDLDLFVSSSNDEKLNKLFVYRNDGAGNFENITDQLNIYQRGFSNVLFDADNDGDFDLYAISDSSANYCNRLYLNDGHGNLTMKSGTGLEVDYKDARGAGVADFDNDGDLDLYVTDTNKNYQTIYFNHLFRNDTPNTGNRWLKLFGYGPKGDAGAFGTKIWIFDKDGWGDLSRLICHKEIISTYGFCCQDDPVQHFGVGKRDTVSVKIRLTDGTVMKYGKLATNQKITFTKTGSIEKLSGDNQSGRRGVTLTEPLKVRILDASGKPLSAVPVRFESKEGTFIGSPIQYTDALGQAQIQYVVAATAVLQKVTVTCSAIAYVYAEFAVNKISIPKELKVLSSMTPSGMAGEILPDSVKVRVVDEEGAAKSEHPVQFQILNGQGSLLPGSAYTAEILTNSSGLATVAWKLGKAAEAYTQQLSICSRYQENDLIGSPVTLSAQAQFPDTLRLALLDGDKQTGPAGTILPQPLRVQLSTSTGMAAPILSIRFKVIAGGGQVSESDSVTVTTNSSGVASVPWRLGVNFTMVQTVLAFLVVNPAHQVAFSAVAQPMASQLLYTGSNLLQGQAGRLMAAPITVQVTDNNGLPIQNRMVLFKVVQGGGKVNNFESVSLSTAANGQVQVLWQLGPQAGKNNQKLFISSDGAAGSPLELSASALAGRAYQMKDQSGDGQVGVPRYVLTQPLSVTVTDSLHNPVAGQSVTFQVTVSDANFSGSSQTNALSDSLGIARAILTLGSQTGAVQVRASSQSAGKELNNSPLLFTATVRLPNPKKLRRTEAEEYVGQAGRVLKSSIKAQVIDELGFPVSGYAVTCRIVAGNGKVNDQDSLRLLTDDQGYAICQWRLGPQPGQRNNQMVFVAPVLQGSPILVTASALAAKAFSMAKVSGDKQSGVVLSSLALPLQVQIVDSLQYPVSNHRVTFQIVQGDATLNQSNVIVVQSDNDGMAGATMSMGTIPGTVQIQASAESDGRLLQFAPLTFTEQLLLPAIDRSRSKLNVDSAVVANGRALVRLQAVLSSPQNQPLPGLHLRFGVSGQANTLVQPQLPTDAQGRAEAFLSSTRAEWKKVWAEILYGTAVLDTVRVQFKAGPAAVLRKISGDEQSAPVGMTLAQPLVVSLSDSFANPVSGFLSLLETGPNGSTRTLPSQWADQLGSGQVYWTLGNLSGLYRLVVNHNLLTTAFTATASARVPGQLLLISGNHQSARGNGLLAQPLTVQVLDTQGDPQSGVPLTFQVLAGGGALSPASGVVTDSMGRAQVIWRVGTSGEQRVKAQVSNLNQLAVEFAAQLRSNQVPLLSAPTEVSVKEGQTVQFVVTGSDADGDSLTFGVVALPEAAGFDPKAHRFTWTPGFHHAGTTKVTFWVQDNYGGRTTGLTIINVQDVPVAPMITAYQPVDTLLSMNGKDLSFSVSASDLDGNVLSYSWWLNGVMMASGNKEFILRYRATLPQHSRLAARVSDGVFFVEQRWQLDITNQVFVKEAIPSRYALLPNYPNPFNPTTHIPFDVAGNAYVRVSIYDHDGRLVRTLANGRYAIGRHELEWDARDDKGSAVASGLYLCVLECEGIRQTRKLTLMK